jgi:hypothetical protein
MERKGRLSDEQLSALEAGAVPVGGVGWRHQPGPLDVFILRGQDETVHLYATQERGQAILAALESAREDIPRLVAEVRRLRAEVEDAHTRKREEAAAPAAAAPRRPVALDISDDDAPLGLAAPFRVGPREMQAAKDDPLVALAVQVAKAVQSDAREIERARLIAMAFAAARGDKEGFWAARAQRSTKAKAEKKAEKKK